MITRTNDRRISRAEMIDDPGFHGWLKQRRKALDMTQGELAALVSCSVETLRKIEAGALRPSRQLAELLAEHLEIPVDERETFVHLARTASRSAEPFRTHSPGGAVERAGQPPTNLHSQPTPFIGRDREVEAVRALLTRDDVRLLTLLGPPGIGKTRLGLRVAADLLPAFEDGVFFVGYCPSATHRWCCPR